MKIIFYYFRVIFLIKNALFHLNSSASQIKTKNKNERAIATENIFLNMKFIHGRDK